MVITFRVVFSAYIFICCVGFTCASCPKSPYNFGHSTFFCAEFIEIKFFYTVTAVGVNSFVFLFEFINCCAFIERLFKSINFLFSCVDRIRSGGKFYALSKWCIVVVSCFSAFNAIVSGELPFTDHKFAIVVVYCHILKSTTAFFVFKNKAVVEVWSCGSCKLTVFSIKAVSFKLECFYWSNYTPSTFFLNECFEVSNM